MRVLAQVDFVFACWSQLQKLSVVTATSPATNGDVRHNAMFDSVAGCQVVLLAKEDAIIIESDGFGMVQHI
jgi:hypothetical protein